jgi:SAM-dependent methyltransferase
MDPLQQETRQTWDKLADLYWDKFSAISLYDETYDYFLNVLPEGQPSVLDLGCGPGIISAYLHAQRQNIRITAVDDSPNMVKKAQEMVPGIFGIVLNISDIRTLQTPFQGIISGFVLPYIAPEEVVSFIKDCHDLLSDNGIFYLSFVDGHPSQSGIKTGSSGDRTLFFYHRKDDILLSLQLSGFTVLKEFTVNYPLQNSETEEHTILIATKSNKKAG